MAIVCGLSNSLSGAILGMAFMIMELCRSGTVGVSSFAIAAINGRSCGSSRTNNAPKATVRILGFGSLSKRRSAFGSLLIAMRSACKLVCSSSKLEGMSPQKRGRLFRMALVAKCVIELATDSMRARNAGGILFASALALANSVGTGADFWAVTVDRSTSNERTSTSDRRPCFLREKTMRR